MFSAISMCSIEASYKTILDDNKENYFIKFRSNNMKR